MGLIPKSNIVLPISAQARSIQEIYSNWEVYYSSRNLTAKGVIQPSVWSPFYHVRLVYDRREPSPEVTLTSPEIKRRNGKLPPHLLDSKKKTLCLYYYKFNEWSQSQLISRTIIPWITLWLYYYEHWLMAGKWLGGGTVHPTKKITQIEDYPTLIKFNK